MINRISTTAALLLSIALHVDASQQPPEKAAAKQQPKKKRRKFQWVNPLARKDLPGVKHAAFRSPSMDMDVGYCIYLPRAYHKRENAANRFPVVYYLHGGRPGSETKSVALAAHIDASMESGDVAPMIYVFVNGGPVSHYNYPAIRNGMGEDVFIKELIPHVDKTYRTIADRKGRGLEGFSQGGRGTARIAFKHPDLFCSAAAGGGGHATEKRISENEGRESANLKFAVGYNTWDLAKKYASKPTPKFRLLIFVGTKGFNYQNNLEYLKYLESLKIPHERLIVPDAPHSAKIIYEKRGSTIMKFHAKNFGLTSSSK